MSWFKESRRHSLASRGIKSAQKVPKQFSLQGRLDNSIRLYNNLKIKDRRRFLDTLSVRVNADVTIYENDKFGELPESVKEWVKAHIDIINDLPHRQPLRHKDIKFLDRVFTINGKVTLPVQILESSIKARITDEQFAEIQDMRVGETLKIGSRRIKRTD